MQSFRDLVESSVNCGMSLTGFADWCHISRQQIYKYMNGYVDPQKISYVNITSMASYLDEKPDVVYNSICESFERVHIWSDEKQRWIKF